MIEGPTAEQERDHLAEQCAELLRENEGLRERLTGEASYLTDAVIPALREENERLLALIEDACKVFDHYDLPEHAFHYRREINHQQKAADK